MSLEFGARFEGVIMDPRKLEGPLPKPESQVIDNSWQGAFPKPESEIPFNQHLEGSLPEPESRW